MLMEPYPIKAAPTNGIAMIPNNRICSKNVAFPAANIL